MAPYTIKQYRVERPGRATQLIVRTASGNVDLMQLQGDATQELLRRDIFNTSYSITTGPLVEIGQQEKELARR